MTMIKPNIVWGISVAVVALMALAACDGETTPKDCLEIQEGIFVPVPCPSNGPTPTPPPPPSPPPPSCEPDLTISVDGNALQFDKGAITAKAGCDVGLKFDNASTFNQHNWVLVKAGAKDEVAQRGLEAGPGNDYVQPGDPDVLVHTRLVNPGETDGVEFLVPEAGTYQFVCTFPAHNFSMFGDFIVTQ